MKHEYVGDIGDFANNGLLRFLCGVTGPATDNPLRLCVVSYLNESEPEGTSGNEIGYLNFSEYNNHLYRECDPVLYDTLQRLVGQSLASGTKRNIDQIRRSLFISEYTQYYNRPVPAGERYDWLKGAIEKCKKDVDLVFLNPDKGIGNNTQRPEHTSISELCRFAKLGRSLVIYQHQTRDSGWIEKPARELLTIKHIQRVWALQWHREQSRAYIIAAQSEHECYLSSRINALLDGPWGKKKPPGSKKEPHFTPAYPPEGLTTCPPSS